MKKRLEIYANLLLIIFPIIIVVNLIINYHSYEAILYNKISFIGLITINIPYFFVLAVFVYVLFIKKIEYNLWILIIGLCEIIILQMPCILLKISYVLFVKMFSQAPLNLILFGSAFVLYALLLPQSLKSKKSS